MFKCAKCEALQAEVQHLRDQNMKLVDRLVALSSPEAFGAIRMADGELKDPNDFYGTSEDDLVQMHNGYGERILIPRVKVDQ